MSAIWAKYVREKDGSYTVYNPTGRMHSQGGTLKSASQEVKDINDSLRKMRGVDLTRVKS